MSVEFGLGAGPAYEGFTVTRIGNCRIVHGMVPASELAMLWHGYSKKAVLDIDLASRIGASFVIGAPADIAGLRTMGLLPSAAREAESAAARGKGLPLVAGWLRDGERGLSSEALCHHLFGLPVAETDDYPHDADDLRRCLTFLSWVSAHDRIDEMRPVSPQWHALAVAWPQLVGAWQEGPAEAAPTRLEPLLRAALATAP